MQKTFFSRYSCRNTPPTSWPTPLLSTSHSTCECSRFYFRLMFIYSLVTILAVGIFSPLENVAATTRPHLTPDTSGAPPTVRTTATASGSTTSVTKQASQLRPGSPQGGQGRSVSPQGQGRSGYPQGQGRPGSPQGQGRPGSPQRQGRSGSPQGQGRPGSPQRQGRSGSPQGQGRPGSPQGTG